MLNIIYVSVSVIPDTPESDTFSPVFKGIKKQCKRGALVLDSDSDESDIHAKSNNSSPWLSKKAAIAGKKNGFQKVKAG